MAILVTGGAGYIGSHVVEQLSFINEEVVIIDNLSTGFEENLFYGTFIKGDISDESLLDQIFAKHKIEAVIHFAGSLVVSESVENPIKYFQNNTANSIVLLNKCIEHKVEKFIFSSTSLVYEAQNDVALHENCPKLPANPYGLSKYLFEQVLENSAKSHNFNFIILRYFNVAGAALSGRLGQRSKKATHLIKVAAELAVDKRKKLEVFGLNYPTRDGTCIRDYIHIQDLAQAHLDSLFYLRNNNKSQILNCGYGVGFSVLEVLKVLEQVCDQNLNIVHADRRAGDPPFLVSNSEKIKSTLGWIPKHNDLREIIKSAIAWERQLIS